MDDGHKATHTHINHGLVDKVLVSKYKLANSSLALSIVVFLELGEFRLACVFLRRHLNSWQSLRYVVYANGRQKIPHVVDSIAVDLERRWVPPSL